MPLEGPEIVRPKEINNKPALKRCYDQIKLDYDWIERLDLITDTDEQFDDKDVNNDFDREQVFYKQAQAAIMEAVPRLKAAGIKVRKPNDYIAEMIKSDSHMDRIKRAHAEREAIMEKIEKAKRIRKERKMAKMVQTQVKISKQEEKKEFNNKIAKFKKGIDKNLDFLDDSGKKNDKDKKDKKKDSKKPTKKTAYKLQKYGLGGQKKRKKYNTAESSADVSSFSNRHNRGPKSQAKTNRGGKKREARETSRRGLVKKEGNR